MRLSIEISSIVLLLSIDQRIARENTFNPQLKHAFVQTRHPSFHTPSFQPIIQFSRRLTLDNDRGTIKKKRSKSWKNFPKAFHPSLSFFISFLFFSFLFFSISGNSNRSLDTRPRKWIESIEEGGKKGESSKFTRVFGRREDWWERLFSSLSLFLSGTRLPSIVSSTFDEIGE